MEMVAVRGQRTEVPPSEVRILGFPSLRRIVMRGPPKDVPAQIVPVGASVAEMEMPCLVDRFGGCDRVSRLHREVDEPFVLADHLPREFGVPTVLPRQAGAERERDPRLFELHGFQFRQQFVLHGSRIRPSPHGMGRFGNSGDFPTGPGAFILSKVSLSDVRRRWVKSPAKIGEAHFR